MHKRLIGRLSAAAILAVGLLVAMAIPASASPTGVTIEGSSVITVGTADPIHVEDHPTTNTCAPNSTTGTPIPISLNSTGGGTVGAGTTQYGDFVVSTNVFKARLVIVSGTITITHTTVSVSLVVRAEFRNCASTQALCTTQNISITLTGANPTTSNLHPSTSTVFNLSGTSGSITVAAVPSCNAVIRAAIFGQTATANLILHTV